MRWTKRKNGDTRVINVFALLPRTIGSEVRWLEWCKIEQTYLAEFAYDRTISMWVDTCFINN